MIANALRIFGWICVVGAALQVFMAAPGDTTERFDPLLRRMVTDRAGWQAEHLVLAAASLAGAALWFASAAALDLLEACASRLGEIAATLRDQRQPVASQPPARPVHAHAPHPSFVAPPPPPPAGTAAEAAAQILAAHNGRITSSTVVQMVNTLEARARAEHPDKPLPPYAEVERLAQRLLKDAATNKPAGYIPPDALAAQLMDSGFGRIDAETIAKVADALEERDRLFAPGRTPPSRQVFEDTASQMLRDALKRKHGG